jgi:hypothetical protein
MHTYVILLILLTFSSVAVSDFLEEVLNAAKCIVDIHQELPNSCVFIITSEVEMQGEDIFLTHLRIGFFLKMYPDFEKSNSESLLGNKYFEII